MGIGIDTKNFEQGWKDLQEWNNDLVQRVNQALSVNQKGKKCPYINDCNYYQRAFGLSYTGKRVFELKVCNSVPDICDFYKEFKSKDREKN